MINYVHWFSKGVIGAIDVMDNLNTFNLLEMISTLDAERFEQRVADIQESYKKLAHAHGDYWMRFPSSPWLMLFGIYTGYQKGVKTT